MASFSVRVLNDMNAPVIGIRVILEFPLQPFMIKAEEYTDKNGYAIFYGYDNDEIEIMVNGNNFGRYYYCDGEGITLGLI
jgi:hypothetical protein